jgi:hypothetical protein
MTRLSTLVPMLVLVAACSRAPAPPEPVAPAPPEPVAPAPAVAATSLIEYDDRGRRLSRGFKPPGSRTLTPLNEAEQAKMDALLAAERAAEAVPFTPAQAARRTRVPDEAAWSFDVYRDDELVRRVPGAELRGARSLSDVLTTAELQGAATILVHGDSGSRLFAATEVEELQLRTNRMGRLKLEVLGRPGRRLVKKKGPEGGGTGAGDGSGSGSGSGGGKKVAGDGSAGTRPEKRRVREREVQGLYWVELLSKVPAAAASPE